MIAHCCICVYCEDESSPRSSCPQYSGPFFVSRCSAIIHTFEEIHSGGFCLSVYIMVYKMNSNERNDYFTFIAFHIMLLLIIFGVGVEEGWLG